MSHAHLQTPEVAHWHALLTCAELQADHRPSVPVEHYLVSMLMRFSRSQRAFLRSICARLERCLQAPRGEQFEAREIGELSLFLCGLYPELARERDLPLDEVAALGKAAFRHAGEKGDVLGGMLAEDFSALCGLLHAVREIEPRGDLQLDPISAFELYQATGSARAATALARFTRVESLAFVAVSSSQTRH